MMTENKKKPNPIDIHVGSRIRLRRTMLGMSQEKLGKVSELPFSKSRNMKKARTALAPVASEYFRDPQCARFLFLRGCAW